MFQRNEITNIVQTIKVGQDIKTCMTEQLEKFDKLNSVIVYNVFDEQHKLTAWLIHYNVSQLNKLNTLKKVDVINYITTNLTNNPEGADQAIISTGYVNCYLQPPLDNIIKSRKPLIIKLAKEQHERWNYLEMEDLIQMCNLVICDLYYKGYYIHKNLIRRAYINYILMHIRKNKSRPEIISLEQEYSKKDDDNVLTIKDMVPDVKQLNDMEDKDNDEVERQILKEMRDIVIDIIGPRQYDQMLREYGNKQTTNWSRKLMQTIKAKLFELGINAKSFNKYYK